MTQCLECNMYIADGQLYCMHCERPELVPVSHFGDAIVHSLSDHVKLIEYRPAFYTESLMRYIMQFPPKKEHKMPDQPMPIAGKQDVSYFIAKELDLLLTQPLTSERKGELERAIQQLTEQRTKGLTKYGTSLMTWNGRDPYADAAQEYTEHLQYITQARMERADLLKQLAEAGEEIAALREQRDEERAIAALTAKERDSARATAARLQKDVHDLEGSASSSHVETAECQRQVVQLTAQLQTSEREVKTLGVTLAGLHKTIQRMVMEREDMEAAIDSLRGVDGRNGRKAGHDIAHLCGTAFANAVNKGFWAENQCLPIDNARQCIPEKLMLMTSELSEALEQYRDRRPDYYYNENARYADESGGLQKPEGIVAELADCCIRIFDLCGRFGWKLDVAINEKMKYNTTRPHMHGKVC